MFMISPCVIAWSQHHLQIMLSEYHVRRLGAPWVFMPQAQFLAFGKWHIWKLSSSYINILNMHNFCTWYSFPGTNLLGRPVVTPKSLPSSRYILILAFKSILNVFLPKKTRKGKELNHDLIFYYSYNSLQLLKYSVSV